MSPITIIGAGRIGTGLRDAGVAAGWPVMLVDRASGWEALGEGSGPLVLAVRNDDLAQVLERVPRGRHPDLVFVQNGAIDRVLAAAGVPDATRGLLYFLVARRGGPIAPGRVSWFTGPRAAEMVAFLSALGLEAQAVDRARFRYQELEKLLWLVVHGPLCEKHGATVSEVGERHRGELTELVAELLPVGSAAWGVEAPVDFVVDRLVDYSSTLPDYAASVKEWPYRNGWFVEQAARFGISCPRHDALLASLRGT